MDQNIWTIITIIASLLAAFVGGATGAILTNRYTRSQEKRRKEKDVIEEIYALALTVRMIIEPSLLAASTPHTIKSTWPEPMIRMTMLSDLYLPSLKSELEELYERIISVENAFTRASSEKDGYGSATKKITPDDFDQITESFMKSFNTLLATLRELTKKRQ